MEKATYVFIAVCGVIAASAVLFCLLRGEGAAHKKLLRAAFLLGTAALLCFGGNAVLSLFGMGWRCAPFNAMLFLCAALLIVTLWRCMEVLVLLENRNPILTGCRVFSLLMMLLVTLACMVFYPLFFSWKDRLSPYDGQMIVCADDNHGGSCDWRYYAHINSLVHGAEIPGSDAWWGTPPGSR